MVKEMSDVISDLRKVSDIKIAEYQDLEKEFTDYREAVKREKEQFFSVENLKMREESNK